MIILSYAWAWNCPSCGERNYDDSVPVELSRDELEELLHEHGIDAREGQMVTAPEVVTCKGCFDEFPASDGSDEEP